MKNLKILPNVAFVKKKKKNDVKVKDYCHITGKYIGSAPNKCKINLSLTKKMPVVFHNYFLIIIHIFSRTWNM